MLCCAGWVDLCPPPGHHAPPPPLVQVTGPPSVGATNGATGSAIHHPGYSGHPVRGQAGQGRGGGRGGRRKEEKGGRAGEEREVCPLGAVYLGTGIQRSTTCVCA